jgi:hypothetical protein
MYQRETLRNTLLLNFFVVQQKRMVSSAFIYFQLHQFDSNDNS